MSSLAGPAAAGGTGSSVPQTPPTAAPCCGICSVAVPAAPRRRANAHPRAESGPAVAPQPPNEAPRALGPPRPHLSGAHGAVARDLVLTPPLPGFAVFPERTAARLWAGAGSLQTWSSPGVSVSAGSRAVLWTLGLPGALCPGQQCSPHLVTQFLDQGLAGCRGDREAAVSRQVCGPPGPTLQAWRPLGGGGSSRSLWPGPHHGHHRGDTGFFRRPLDRIPAGKEQQPDSASGQECGADRWPRRQGGGPGCPRRPLSCSPRVASQGSHGSRGAEGEGRGGGSCLRSVVSSRRKSPHRASPEPRTPSPERSTRFPGAKGSRRVDSCPGWASLPACPHCAHLPSARLSRRPLQAACRDAPRVLRASLSCRTVRPWTRGGPEGSAGSRGSLCPAVSTAHGQVASTPTSSWRSLTPSSHLSRVKGPGLALLSP